MSDEQLHEETQSDREAFEQAWHEVGNQFKVLGQSLAAAFRQTVQDKEAWQEVQSGLESAVNAIDRAIKETSASPEGQRVRDEVEKAAESARAAGEQAFREMQPHLLVGLSRLRDGLQRAIDRLKEEEDIDVT